ncbi:MAG: NUDIX hydrolase [Alphaproteobacteria bacterium]|jgi:8-oxo-dGTP pyrophosphatase MutT (NUDIX family)|nr:NUDIX hydrolase [Alphaproteobacteria bacterium]
MVRDGLVLLARRSGHRRRYPGVWDVIGGHLEAGESIEETLVREVEEEVGVTPNRFSALGEIDEPNPEINDPHVYHLFTVHDWSGGEPRLASDEHTEIGWFSLAEAVALDLALPEYRDYFRRVLAAG